MKPDELEPRVVLITGGSSGIGLETVKQFAARGDRVYTCARNDFDFSAAISAQQLQQIEFQILDLNNVSDLVDWIHEIAKREGQIQVMVNNAAVVVRKELINVSSDEFQNSLDVNLLAVLESVKAAVPYMKPSSTVINLSSMAAIDPFPGFSVYGACKSFIEVFTSAISGELAERGISCFSIRAGAVNTPLLQKVLPDFPLEQALDPSSVAKLILRLSIGQHEYKTGEVVEISS